MSQTDAPDTPSNDEIGLDLQIETPENVVLSYQLAGPAARLGAYLIDFAVRAAAVIVIVVIALCTGLVMPGTVSGILLLVFFFMEWCYFIVSEGLYRGKSIGKHVLGLRVIHERGHPLTFWGAVQRNLLRFIDAMPLYGPGFIAMLLTPRMQRMGDLVAGTVVISERRVALPREPIILEKIEALPRQDLGTYVPERGTLSLIEDFLTRRHILTHERGHAMASPLAKVLAKRLAFRGDPDLPLQYPMAFLARVYVTFLEREDEEEDQIDWRPRRRRPERRRERRQKQTVEDW